MTNQNDSLNVSDLGELAELVSNCENCELHKTKTKDVFGDGSPSAEIMFIGEAPGKNEDLEGIPFVGAAGKFLSEMLVEIGLSRKDIYIANVLKHRPPNNRDPLPNEIEACWPYLAKQIELISPKLIVFLGRHALNRFFPAAKISEVHGKAFRKPWQGEDQIFLALYHPAAALYNGGMRETLMNDFKKIPKIIEKINQEKSKLTQSKLI
jgi:DNA polymerase